MEGAGSAAWPPQRLRLTWTPPPSLLSPAPGQQAELLGSGSWRPPL